jgi:hypothetical protein
MIWVLPVTVEPFQFSSRQVGVAYELSQTEWPKIALLAEMLAEISAVQAYF